MRKNWIAYLLLTFIYVISGKLGLMLALPPGYASPIFIPAGIAIASVFIGGKKFLPWVLVGSFILNIWVGYSTSHQLNYFGIVVAFSIAIASMLQAGLGGWILRKVIGYPAPFDRSKEIFAFLLLTPLFCLTSATFSVTSLWILGVFEATNLASNWSAWWVGDTLGVVLVFPLVMIFVGEPRLLWRSRKLSVAIPMILVFSIFVAIFLKTNQWEYNDSLSDFRQLSQQAINQVNTKLEEQEFLLEQTVGLFKHDVHGKVTGTEFHRFVQHTLHRFSMIQALEWAPEVDLINRDVFEAEWRQELSKFEIRERDATGNLQRAGERAAYHPVTFVEPLATNEPAVGFDLGSNPSRLEAIKKSILTGNVVITSGVRLVQEQQQQTGVLLILAVDPKNEKSALVLTVLRVGDFMDKLLTDLHPMLYTRLIDIRDQKTIYDTFLNKTQPALYEHDFEFGARHYRLETAPTSAYLNQHHGWQSWGVLVVGILGTGLLGALLLLGTGYNARMEAQVEDRTRELEKESLKNEIILRNSSDGIHILDSQGNLVEASESFFSMLDYMREELIGMNVSLWDAGFNGAGELLTKIKQQLETPERIQFETRHRRKDGTVFDVEVSGLSLMLEGKPIIFNSARDITERKKMEEQIKQYAYFDKLTKLPNRRLLEDRLKQSMSTSKRSGKYGALMFLDLDNFKPLNDLWGHALGDQLLIEVAERIRSSVREVDTVARFGGDEFVVILNELDSDKTISTKMAFLVADKIRLSISNPFLLKFKEEGKAEIVVEHQCTSSIGMKFFIGQDETMDKLLQYADSAMYRAKDSGRNTIRISSTE